MDKTDQKILLELDKDPRASFKRIGRAAHISKEVAQYRFKQLIKDGVLTGFFAFVNVSKMGYTTYKILVKYKSVNKESQDEIIKFLKESKVVAWAGNCEGAWDLMITAVSQSQKEFAGFFNNFFETFGKYFKEKELLLPVDNPLFNDKYLSEGRLLYSKHLDFHALPEKIDDIDRKIITQISLNSRSTFTKIGKKLGLSYWTIAQRFKKLILRDIIILLKPRINFRKMGYSYYHLFIELDNEKTRKEIISYYRMQKDCLMAMNHMGRYSLHLEFVLKKEAINELVMDLRDRFGGSINGYELLLVYDEYVMNLLR